MVRNLVTSLFEHGRVVTSPAKAKEARPVAEKLITMAKGGTLAHRRRAISALNDKRVVAHLFDTIAPRYAQRPGGYTRILHLDRHRIGDGGDQCLFELVEEEIGGKKKKGARAKARVQAEPEAAPAAAPEPQAAEAGSEAEASSEASNAESNDSAPAPDATADSDSSKEAEKDEEPKEDATS